MLVEVGSQLTGQSVGRGCFARAVAGVLLSTVGASRGQQSPDGPGQNTPP
ncbi:hypothetical protein [Streptomyces olivaceus]